MLNRTLIVVVLLILFALTAAPVDDAAASCQGEEYATCLGTACSWVPTQGHCEGSHGLGQGGGKWCVAGGGSCAIVP